MSSRTIKTHDKPYTYEFKRQPVGFGPDAIPDAWHIIIRDGSGGVVTGTWWLTEAEARTDGVALACRQAERVGARLVPAAGTSAIAA